MGHLRFELSFGGGGSAVSELYNVVYEGESVLAYLQDFDGETLTFDPVEWITFPSQRARELELEDPGGGFLIYNEQVTARRLPVEKSGVCTVLNWEADYAPGNCSMLEFLDVLRDRAGTAVPYHLTIQEGKIVEIREQYVP